MQHDKTTNTVTVNTQAHYTMSNNMTRFKSQIQKQLRNQNTHTDDAIMNLLNDLRTLKSRLNFVGMRGKTQYRPVVVAMFGFGNVQHRNNCLRAIRYTMNPRLIHCSQTGQMQWECIMVLSVRESCLSTFYDNATDQFIVDLDIIMDQFKLSINVLELVSWKDPSTVACVERIQNGLLNFGNWSTERNTVLRMEYELEKTALADAKRTQFMQEQTGRQFTIGNMLELYYERRNAELETNRFRDTFQTAMRNIAMLQHAAVTHAQQLQQLHIATYNISGPGQPATWPTSNQHSHLVQAAVGTHSNTMAEIANMRQTILHAVLPQHARASAQSVSDEVIDLTNDTASESPPVTPAFVSDREMRLQTPARSPSYPSHSSMIGSSNGHVEPPPPPNVLAIRAILRPRRQERVD